MYSCDLWINYTQKSFNVLKVEYYTILKMLLQLPSFCSLSCSHGWRSCTESISSTTSRMRGSGTAFERHVGGCSACHQHYKVLVTLILNLQ